MKNIGYYTWLKIHAALRLILSAIILLTLNYHPHKEIVSLKILVIILLTDLTIFSVNVMLHFFINKRIKIL
jgi:hypothetical protein